MSLLLTSVFRPFGVDDEYGRKENKLELFHNQVTREQGIFSIRSNHRSFGLYFIAENIKMPTTVLDFPTLKQFRREVKKGYDYVGISFIVPNFAKAKKMAEIVREVAPSTKIILGGHGTPIPDIEKLIDCDYVIKGEGIGQLRELFGEDMNAPVRHPAMPGSDHKRILGLPVPQKNAVLITGVGCPNGCRFCSTSHFFGKTYYPFLKTGREIYDTILRLSCTMKTNDFFVMDENFLKHKERAMELLEIIERDGRCFNFSIFSSAEAIMDFGVENMVRLGVIYVWIGVESKKSLFEKTNGVDVKKLIADLRGKGIIVLASSILFLEHHNRETIQEDIDFAISLNPDFTQFMQFGPAPVTPLYLDYKAKAKLLEDIPYEEWHGQKHIYFNHPDFSREESETILRDAFRKEYAALGPSILRAAETMIRGLDDPIYQTSDQHLLRRYEILKQKCGRINITLKVLKWLAPTKHMKDQADRTIGLYNKHFGRRPLLELPVCALVYVCACVARMKADLGHDAKNPDTIISVFRTSPRRLRRNTAFAGKRRKQVITRIEAVGQLRPAASFMGRNFRRWESMLRRTLGTMNAHGK
ncbi:MAG: B12-binding domain-containing radical SAM protein [bacterium]